MLEWIFGGMYGLAGNFRDFSHGLGNLLEHSAWQIK